MTQLPELPWIAEARSHIGQREIKGTKHNPFIVGIWAATGVAWFIDDDAVVRWVHSLLPQEGWQAHPQAVRVGRALAWADYGVKLKGPAYGCIGEKGRKGGGHVTFIVGKDQYGNLMGLGGNQNDSVKISPFKAADFTHFIWPSIYPSIQRFDLPLLSSDGRMVTEA